MISRHVVAVFDPGVKASPALQVDVYGPPGVTHKEPPRRIGTMSARRLYSVADAVVLPRHVVLFGPSQRVANWSFFSRDRFRHPGLVEQNGDVWLSDPVDRGGGDPDR